MKGFDKDFKCKDVQYKVGETAKYKGDLKLCASGLHFCENPLDVLNYYNDIDSRYAIVESKNVSNEKETDSKRVTSKLIIVKEISKIELLQQGIKLLTSGDEAHSATSGKNSIACALGNNSYAKSTKENWLVLSEYDDQRNIICVKTAKVDGKKIKENIYYKLQNGKFTEVK